MLLTRKTLSKQERLKSKKLLNHLYTKGESFYVSPFRVKYTYHPLEAAIPAQVAISIPKRLFKKAVTRNLLKRRIKEAYRLNKNNIYQHLIEQKRQMLVLIIYTGSAEASFADINKKIKLILSRLTEDESGA